MDLDTIVKLVDAGFTADEIRTWAVAKQTATARPMRQRTARRFEPPAPAPAPAPAKEEPVLQELPAQLPLSTKNIPTLNLNIRRGPRRPAFGAADLAEVPKEVTDYLTSVLESSPGTNVVSYDELKERVAYACPQYKSSIYRAVKGLFPTVTHTRQDGRGPYVLTDVAWRRK